MKARIKTWAAFLLALALLLGLTACGRAEEETEPETAFVSEPITLPEGISYLQGACLIGEDVYMIAQNQLSRISLTEGAAEALPNYTTAGVPDGTIHAAPDGTLVILEEQEQMSGGENPNGSYVVRRLDQEGTELFRYERENKRGEPKVTGMLLDADGDIFIRTAKQVEIASPSGETRFTLPTEEDLFESDDMILLGDGRVGIQESVRNGEERCIRLRTVDKEGRSWGKSYSLSEFARLRDGDANALFYYVGGDSLYAWQEELEAGKPLINLLNAGYAGETLDFIAPMSGGRVVLAGRDGSQWFDIINHGGQWNYEMTVLAPTEDAPEKTAVTYATTGLTTIERFSIMHFNRTNPDYQIKVIDYSDYGSSESWEAAMTRLATEIGAGKIPDILAVSGVPTARWAASGLLEDLWPWIDNDPELDREDLMERVFEASEINGKLYEICDNFRFVTVAGRKDVVGDRMTWTPEDMWAALEKMPEGCVPLEGTKIELLDALMSMDWNRFVDWENSTCSFDGEEFKEILKFCASVPNGPPHGSNTAWARDGRLMLYTYYPGEFDSVQHGEYALQGEISFVGYPNPWGETGSSFIWAGGCMMTSACAHKEGAWAYLRTLLLPKKDQFSEVFSAFPVNKEDMERLRKTAMAPMKYESSFGFYSDGERFTIQYRTVTQEEYDQLMALYGAVETFNRKDNALSEIITEVSGAYFAGDKTLDETAELIQRRAQLYVNEQT